jgi:hypothetical protein
MHVAGQTWGKLTCRWRVGPVLKIEEAGIDQNRKLRRTITYELLSHAIERSNNIVSLFKELENIRINA